jgi:hypothetical protein
MERWERRDRKKQADANRMKKSGVSVRLIQQLIAERAAKAKAKAESSKADHGERSGDRGHRKTI